MSYQTVHIDYKTQSEALLQTLQYIEDNPWKTILWSYLPVPNTSLPFDRAIFRILKCYCLVDQSSHMQSAAGSDNTVISLIRQQFEKTVSEHGHSEQSCQFFHDTLYDCYANLLAHNIEITHTRLAKNLKKWLHQYAENNPQLCDKRILNVVKVFQALRKAYQKKYKQQADRMLADKFPNLSRLAQDSNNHYKYVVLSHLNKHQFNQDEITALTNAKIPTEPTASMIRYRHFKKLLSFLVISCALTVAVGEGMTAAVFFSFLPILVAIPTIGLCGAVVNYIFFMPSCKQAFKKIFLWKLFQDDQGRSVSLLKKGLITASLMIAFSGAFAIGTLSFATASAAMAALFSSIFPPFLIVCLAGVLATTSAIALGSTFFTYFAQFIANDHVKKIPGFLKDLFYLKNYRQATAKDWLKHIVKITITTLLFSTAGLVLLFSTIASFGLFKQSALNLVQTTLHLSNTISELIATVLVGGVAVIINLGFFKAVSLSAFAMDVRNGLFFLCLKLNHQISSLINYFFHTKNETNTDTNHTTDVPHQKSKNF